MRAHSLVWKSMLHDASPQRERGAVGILSGGGGGLPLHAR